MTAVPLNSHRPQATDADLSELDDAELVERARCGEEQAFQQLFVRHQSRLRANTHSIVTGADLDDVSQRTWLKIFRKLHTLREPRLFYAWANRVAVNTALAFVRSRSRRSETALDDLTPAQLPADDRPNAAEKASWQGLIDKTRQWFAELETRDRKLFHHFLVDGMSMEEIGEAVGMSAGGVKARMFRAREVLRTRRNALTS